MILIADSGSTKTEWQVVEHNEKHFFTSGINPYYQSMENIVSILSKELPESIFEDVSQIYFYGAGCNTDAMKSTVKDALLQLAPSHPKIEIESDLFGAARSLCQHNKGIACILGTGSNSCYYDGQTITSNVSPLGFILGDEGSGAVLGKRFVGNLLKFQLPNYVYKEFFKEYNITPSDILKAVYKEPFPNRYLANFSRFIFKHIDDPILEKLVMDEFSSFFRRNVMQYPNCHELPIHFVGSVAFNYRLQLETVMARLNLSLGTISQVPMSGLVKYHTS